MVAGVRKRTLFSKQTRHDMGLFFILGPLNQQGILLKRLSCLRKGIFITHMASESLVLDTVTKV